MKKVIFFLGILLLAGFVYAVPAYNNLHLNIQTTFSNGSIQTGTFAFIFNISSSSDCADVNIVYSNSTSLTTDSRGIISYYLPNVTLDYNTQYWLCYYKNGVLTDTSELARVPYAFEAKNTTLSGVEVDKNLNMGGYNITAANFYGNGSQLTGVLTSLSETDPYWTDNFTKYNSTWSSITNQTYHTGYLYATNGTYYLATNPLGFFNDISNFTGTLTDSKYCTYSLSLGKITCDSTATVSEADPYWTGNYSTFLTHITWANAINGTLAKTDAANTFGIFNQTFDTSTLFIDSISHRVGIGTTTPQNLLNVAGNINFTGLIYGNGSQLTGISSGGSGVPVNTISAFNLASCPTGWILADGSSGTPDLRGIFIRGSGTNGVLSRANGTAFIATYGTYKNDSMQGHRHPIVAQWNTAGGGATPNILVTKDSPAAGTDTIGGGTSVYAGLPITDTIDGVPRTGAETNPAYYATIYCVKTSEDTPVSNTIWGTSGSTIVLNNQSQSLNINNTFVVDSVNGRVGIRTTSPLAKLDINTSLTSTGVIIEANSAQGTGYSPRLGLIDTFSNPASSALVWYLDNYATNFRISTQPNISATGSVMFFINGSSGNVGIGTTTPGVLLDVRSNSATTSGYISTSNSGATNQIGLYSGHSGDPNSAIYWTTGTPLRFGVSTSGTVNGAGFSEYMRITGGKVGIGTTSPGSTLSVNGNVGINGGMSMGADLTVGTTIRQGNAIACTLTASGAGTIQCSSDERLKDIEGNSTYGLKEIMNITPIKYNLKNETYIHIGFSAQNIQKVIPEATPIQGDGYLGLDANAITATLVKAMQEQQNIILSQNDTINQQNQTINQMKLSLCNLGAKEWC
jgi:hypothetical protein